MMSFVNEKAIRILPKLLYPMIHPQRVEGTAKWKEQSTDVNYEINPEHRQLQERPKHQSPNTSYRDTQVTGQFGSWGEGFKYYTPCSHFLITSSLLEDGKIPPPFFFFQRTGERGRCAGSREGKRELVG